MRHLRVQKLQIARAGYVVPLLAIANKRYILLKWTFCSQCVRVSLMMALILELGIYSQNVNIPMSVVELIQLLHEKHFCRGSRGVCAARWQQLTYSEAAFV